MKVLQLIDALDAGGAERIAVNLANEFPRAGIQSFLCSTRAEGILKNQLNEDVTYLFLGKKSTVDIVALFRLKSFIKKHNINVIHAHSTSFFFASLFKFIYPRIQLVWHTHLGARATNDQKGNAAIVFCSRFFDGVVAVNQDLKEWCDKQLKTRRITYIPNGVPLDRFISPSEATNKNIVCVANLKPPKNHQNLIEAFSKVVAKHPDITLHLVGQLFQDNYERDVREKIQSLGLDDKVIISGQQKNVSEYLEKAGIGVLSSDNEGLPMALLEYGASGLAVVSTAVGQCAKVVGEDGLIVPTRNASRLAEALLLYIENDEKRRMDAVAFQKRIKDQFTVTDMVTSLIEFYKA
ncbi:MAG: glycosyltransferase [Bacteroidetes bacterium]|nr:glycosyltransferase [Bacteroidota bacterium]